MGQEPMSPAFIAACLFHDWEQAHPTAPEPVRRMTRDEIRCDVSEQDFEHAYKAVTTHVEF